MPPRHRTPRSKKKHYIAPKPKKPKIWARIVPGLAMLRYKPEFKETKATAMARRNKNASVCILAPVYGAVETFKDWSSTLVENLFETSSEVHRLTLQQLKLRGTSSFPIQCVCPTFLLNENKVTILVRPSPISSPIQGGVTSSLEDDQVRNVEKLLTENHGIVMQLAGKTFAFWKDKSFYLSLVPEGYGSPENYTPALLKSNELRRIMEHVLKNEKGAADLYTVKVLNKAKVRTNIQQLNEEFKLPAPTETPSTPKEETPAEEAQPPPPPETKKAPTKKAKKKEEEDNTITEDQIIAFSADYKEFPDNRGILVGSEYCSDPDRILHTLIAAGLFLHHFPANLWTSTIIRDIMNFGKRIFMDSEDDDLLDEEDWIDRVKFPVKFVKKEYSCKFEKAVFGTVTSTTPQILSVDRGLMKFFENHDTGILAGPQMVLVWQNKNNYFMFDPKERDELGRKWTRYFSAELGSTALSGSACVTWYRNAKKMGEVYTDNVPLKHRNDPYRIVKIRFYETPSKLEDLEDWIGTARDKWILVGTKTLCDYSHAEDKMRPGKAIAIAVSSLITALDTEEIDWNSETIDQILTDGLELFKQSLPETKPKVEKPFTISSIKKIAEVNGKRMRITAIEGAIRGQVLHDNPKHKNYVQLPVGIHKFFDEYRFGVFNVKEISLSIWRGKDNHYYLFYPYEKLFGLGPNCTCADDENLPPMGMANTMRFKTIDDLLGFLTTSLHIKESDEYIISPVEIVLSEASQRPPLLEYEEYGETGAVLRPFKDLHEGHEMFGVRADKQTLYNLMTALGFNRINPSTNWTKEDMADILNIGDKLFCKVFMGLPECQSRDYQLQWDDIKPVIGINKFSYTRDPIQGVLEIPPEVVGEGEEGETAMQEEGVEGEEGVEQQDELFVRPQEGGFEPSTTKDLNGILGNWDKMDSQHHEAIMETDFFKIAIWKRDNLYFIFDPKASGDNGELTERRIEIGKDHAAGDTNQQQAPVDMPDLSKNEPLFIEKRNYSMFNNDGSAYVSWFQSYDEFKKHIKSLTLPEYKYGSFTLHQLVLSSTLIGAEDLESYLRPGFRDVSNVHSILRGSMTQKNPSLSNRGMQELSNCIVALAFAIISPSNKMTTTLLDVILKYGDRLYSKSANNLRKTDKDKYCSMDKLTLNELASIFSIYKIKFNWKVTTTSAGNMLMHDLKKSAGKLGTIEGGTAIILVHKGYTVVFWRSEGSIYLYDPFETNPSGQLTENGLPSLSKFAKIDNLFNYLISKYLCQPGRNLYTMYTINIKSQQMVEIQVPAEEARPDSARTKLVAAIPKEHEMFRPYQNGMRILKSPLNSNKFFSHALALAALVHSRLQFVELWTYNVSQRIYFLSRFIVQGPVCDLDDSQPPLKFDDVHTNFTIDNDILCHIVFTRSIQGPIRTEKRTEVTGINVKNALILFFRSCQHAILTMPGLHKAFAIWKENGTYYLFGSCRKEMEIMVIASPTLANLFDTVLKGTEPEANVNNWYELRSVVITTVPIKVGLCKPVLEEKMAIEGPMSTKSDVHHSLDSTEAQYFDHVADKPEGEQYQTPARDFKEMDHGIQMLQSKNIIPEHRFYGTKDFFPSLQAACIAASALSRVKVPALWTKKTLVKLLAAGTNMYINTIAVKGSSNVEIVDFKGNLYVADCRLEVCPLTPTVQTANREDLLMCLTCILRKYQTSYLYTENFCFALILEDNGCYLYFPGSDEPLCTDWPLNCSCLIRFCSISDLLDKILANRQIAMCETVCIGPILF